MIEGRLMSCAIDPTTLTVDKKRLQEISGLLHALDMYMHNHPELKPLTITYPKEGIDPERVVERS